MTVNVHMPPAIAGKGLLPGHRFFDSSEPENGNDSPERVESSDAELGFADSTPCRAE